MDQESNNKQQEIIDLLVAAGYFRASIKGLSIFDKIVGGMVFCLESMDVEAHEALAVDFLFQESFTIGQKIALTEKIVAVLPKVGCPNVIEPHQIQGLDYEHILPVIQWLVQKSVEHRSERAEKLKSLAIDQFNNYMRRSDEAVLKSKQSVTSVLEQIRESDEKNFPKRRFQRNRMLSEDLKSKVRTTLLEYTNKDLKAVSQESAIQIADDYDALLPELSELDEDQRQEIFRKYAELASEFSGSGAQWRPVIQLLEAEKATLESKLEGLKKEGTAKEVKTQQAKEELEATQAKIAASEVKLNDLSAKLETYDPVLLKSVEQLLAERTALTQQQTEYKRECREKLANLEREVAEYQRTTRESLKQEYQERLEAEQQQLNATRLRLAKKNRSITKLQRQLDVPDRIELSQYQRRFFELYSQINAKHRETKQFYTQYNSLGDVKLYLEKELQLLNSIYEGYNECQISVVDRPRYLEQFEAIIEGVKQSTGKVRRKYLAEKERHDDLTEQLKGLLELQRRYAAMVKSLKMLVLEAKE